MTGFSTEMLHFIIHYTINEWKLVKSQIPKTINSDTILFSWSRSNKSWYCQCGNRYLRLLYFKRFKWKWKLVKSRRCFRLSHRSPKLLIRSWLSFSKSRSNDYKIESWLHKSNIFKWKWKLVMSQIPEITNSVMIIFF